jgi:hypothetical protein
MPENEIPKLLKFYRTITDETDVVPSIIKILCKDRFYPEHYLKHRSGGRDGDLGDELMEYHFLVGGTTNGYNFGRFAGIYQVTMGASVKHVSVLLQPNNVMSIAKDILDKLDHMDFVTKHHVLNQADNLGWRRYKTWLDDLVYLNEGPFVDKFRRK